MFHDEFNSIRPDNFNRAGLDALDGAQVDGAELLLRRLDLLPDDGAPVAADEHVRRHARALAPDLEHLAALEQAAAEEGGEGH